MIEPLIEAIGMGIFLAIVGGAVWAFKGRRPYRWVMASLAVLYVPALVWISAAIEASNQRHYDTGEFRFGATPPTAPGE